MITLSIFKIFQKFKKWGWNHIFFFPQNMILDKIFQKIFSKSAYLDLPKNWKKFGKTKKTAILREHFGTLWNLFESKIEVYAELV